MATTPAPTGYALVGRLMTIQWDDKHWYKAMVTAFTAHHNRYRVIYTDTHEFENVNLDEVVYKLCAKYTSQQVSINVGRVIEYRHPRDQCLRKALVYAENMDTGVLRIANLTDEKMFKIRGGGWEYLSHSPCIIHDNVQNDGPRLPSTSALAQIADEDFRAITQHHEGQIEYMED